MLVVLLRKHCYITQYNYLRLALTAATIAVGLMATVC